MDYGNIPGIKTGRVDANNVITKEELIDQDIAQPGVPANPNRFYRASKKTGLRSAPRTWRTRVDPFANSWDEIRLRLELTPEIVAREIIQWLMEKYPGEYSMGQTRDPAKKDCGVARRTDKLNRPGNSGDPLVCIWTPPFMQQYMY